MARIGTNYSIFLAQKQLSQNRLAHTNAMEPLSTGRRINRASDEPTRLSEYFQQRGALSRIEQYQLNVSTARVRVNVTDAALQEVSELLGEAYELALQGNDQTLTAGQLTFITDRLKDIKTDVLELANTKHNNKYIFAGFLSNTEPFTGDPVGYNGDSNVVNVKVTSSKNVQVNVDPDEVFLGGGTGVDIFDTLDQLVTQITAKDDAAIGILITDMQTAVDQISSARSTLANSAKSLDFADQNLNDLTVQISERISVLSDVDIAAATTELSLKEFALQSSLAVTQRVLSIQLQGFLQ